MFGVIVFLATDEQKSSSLTPLLQSLGDWQFMQTKTHKMCNRTFTGQNEHKQEPKHLHVGK